MHQKIERKTGLLLATDVTAFERTSHLTRGTVLVQVPKAVRKNPSPEKNWDRHIRLSQLSPSRGRAAKGRTTNYKTLSAKQIMPRPELSAAESIHGKTPDVLVLGEKEQ